MHSCSAINTILLFQVNHFEYKLLKHPDQFHKQDIPLILAGHCYVMVVEGKAEIAGKELNKRDAIGISDATSVELKAVDDVSLLIIEVPMN